MPCKKSSFLLVVVVDENAIFLNYFVGYYLKLCKWHDNSFLFIAVFPYREMLMCSL